MGWKKIYCVNILLPSIPSLAPKGQSHNFLSHHSHLIWPGRGLVTASSCPMNRLKTALAGLCLSEPLLLELCIFVYINILQRNIWVCKKGSGTSGWVFPNLEDGHECHATSAMCYFVSHLILCKGILDRTTWWRQRERLALFLTCLLNVMFPRNILLDIYSFKH